MTGWQGKQGPYLIAEIGGNHEGDFDYAQRLTQLACESGVDAVKFQIYTGDTLVSRIEDPQRNKHFSKFELKPKQYIELAKQCRLNDTVFLASVWDMSALEWIDPYLEYYKIGSGDLTAYPILKAIISTRKPIILSTGLSTLDEVREAVNYVQSLDSRYKRKEYFALLQCTSMYPIPNEDANLRVIELLREEFNLPVGYSDHTIGTAAVETAVAMGAEIIEMHFTDSRDGKSFRDHQISFTCEEIQQLILRIKKINELQGEATKTPTPSEIESNHVNSFRRAVYPIRDLPSGTTLSEEDLILLRPNHGIDARDYGKVIGKKLQRSVSAHQRLSWDDFE
jgi:N-acetylneuraminate synthase/N,N'-diacetyllegionaminate synthase